MSFGLETGENLVEFPKKIFSLNEDGSFKELIKPNARLENSAYWRNQHAVIGLVMLGSSFFLLATLLIETDVLRVIWGWFLLCLASIIGL